MRRGTLASMLVAVLASLFVAGCGGNDDDEETAGGGQLPADRQGYVARVNGICARFNEQVGAIEQELFGPYEGKNAPRRAYSEFAERSVPLIRDGFEEVRAVEPPPDAKPEVDAILRETDKGIRQMEKAAEDPAQARPFYRTEGPFAEQNELADQFGMVECAHQYNPRADE